MAKKIVTEEMKRVAKDKRLQRQYGITLAKQDQMRQEQENKCKICRADFTIDNPPCTDHYHYKVWTQKMGKKIWQASSQDERGLLSAIVIYGHHTQVAAREDMRKVMGPRCVRGLLCRKCNRGLGYIERFFDAAHHPKNLLPVIEYFATRLKKRELYACKILE